MDMAVVCHIHSFKISFKKFDMKIIAFFFFMIISCFAQLAIAQISVEIDTVITAVIEEPDLVAHNTFTNQIPQLKTFRWTREEIDIAEGWSTTICDKNLCYVPSVKTAEVELGPGASSILDLHLYTNDIFEGYAFIEVKIEDVADSSNVAFAYYLYDSSMPVSIDELPSSQFNIYPNPSNGLFYIENSERSIGTIKIFDIAGAEILHIPFTQKKWVDLFQLQSGIYIIHLFDNQKELLGTKMVTKH